MTKIQVYEGPLPKALETEFQFCKVYTFPGTFYGPRLDHLKQALNYNIELEANSAKASAIHGLERMIVESKEQEDSSVELVADVIETRREKTVSEERGHFTPTIIMTIQAIGYKRRKSVPL